MPHTPAQLESLRAALASGEHRVSFGDKTIEYRSVEELRIAIHEVEAALARDTGTPRTRQIRMTTNKGF